MLASSRSRHRQAELRGVVICTTPEIRKALSIIQEQANSLGATFTEVVTSTVTHLICNRAGSAEHRAICEHNAGLASADRVLVVKKAWLETCVSASLHVSAQPYILPPLTGMVVCCSGLSVAEKGLVEKICSDLGAQYTKTLDNECTHLISNTTEGKKYDFAASYNIIIVRQKWIHECGRLNVLLDETPYLLSAQGAENNPIARVVGAQSHLMNTDSISRLSSYHTAPIPAARADAEESPLCNELESLCVYLSQSPLRDADKHAPLRARALKLLALAGATALPEPNPHPHFIIVLRVPIAPSTIEPIKEAVECGVYITTLAWLEDCVKHNKIQPHERHAPPDWQQEGGMDVGRSSSDGLVLSQTPSQAGVATSRTFHGCRVSLGALWLRDEANCEEVERQLVNGRAKLLPYDNSGKPIAGVPTHIVCASDLQSRERTLLENVRTANERVSAVTPFWVYSCTAAEKLVPVSACVLFKPLPYGMPLRGMVEQRVSITLSGFQRVVDGDWNRRREVLSRLADLLGAKYSERMRRRSTTHVVADDQVPESNKVQMARKWGIKVVNHEWLLFCAKTGKVVPEEGFGVDVIERKDEPVDANEEDNVGNKSGERGLETTPRRSARLMSPAKSNGGNRNEKKGYTDAAAISLFKRLTEGLEERPGQEGDSIENNTENGTEVEDGRFRGRRSRSVSRDAHTTERDWSMDASQSQVIVHRDLTPPPTPKSKGRTLSARSTKR